MARGGGNHPSRDDLLQTRVMDVATYAAEVTSKIKISKALSLELYGSKTVPIPIPLHPNETRQQYEASFVEWLFRERNHTKEELRSKANLERSLRIAFARAEARAYLLAEAMGDGDDDIKDVKMEEEVVLIPGLAPPARVKREREEPDDDGPLNRKLKSAGENDTASSPPPFEGNVSNVDGQSGVANGDAVTSEGAGDHLLPSSAADVAGQEAMGIALTTTVALAPPPVDSDGPQSVVEESTMLEAPVDVFVPSNDGVDSEAMPAVKRGEQRW
jgi:hypothetical protein